MDLYTHTDPLFSRLLTEGIETGKIASGMDVKTRGGAGDPNGMEHMATGAARLLAEPTGPRIAALAFEGWDTHAQELGRLSRLLTGLDNSFAAFERELGPAWKDTVIVAITEFGRTARINGTQGTDHGTGTIMFLAGGAVGAVESSPTGRASSKTSCVTDATLRRRPICVRSSKALRSTCWTDLPLF